MPPLSPEQVITGYGRAVAAVRAAVVAYARAAWTAQGQYRDADVDDLVRLIAPRVQAGQVQVAQLTAAYVAQVATLRGTPTRAARVDVAEVTGGRGVDPAEVYRRPAVETYTALAQGAAFPDAVARGLDRLTSLVQTDVQMAKVRQARSSFRASGAKYFRRVLNGSENCALCMLAATQRYHRDTLSPIHPGCDCGVDALPDSTDPGQVLDPDEVERIHDQVAATFGTSDRGGRAIDYRLIQVRDHGEMGPVLTWRGQNFTGPADL